MVHQLLMPSQEIRTDRLLLTPLSPADIDDVHAVFSDARTWTHLPAGRHAVRASTVDLVQRKIGGRARHGLGSWAVRAATDHAFLGVGGVDMTAAGVWNLGYRLAPAAWGNGYATEIALAAVAAAADVAPDVAVTGRVLTNNPASAAVLDRAGLQLVWQGSTSSTLPDGVERQVWADRALSRTQRAWLVANA
ncbi:MULTISPECIES: GNAT family N-acetyltransferase [unclassified Curtobacterium]|uniref:GNAT family N-acetyltransferase n=1 Tax=unclassified Curtobacterium TaxID=257496 RepID=UPI00285DC2C2|nr:MULTISPECIES: GNAT family N-acetyltransferase [unclassified Curtobacterium]MDR6170110.1 RimJ/RimL family protein N-acetyltransferase [Curtobacterium sp. SORGH_AS_0776]MDR6574208.1 RimJ/RimL family protein N-acetyltransferase [Curtobacterium sp. 320]